MRGYLLDTNVISMLSPSRDDASPAFLQWLEDRDREGRIFLSVITVHEIEKGIALLEHKGATAKARDLLAWNNGLVDTYDDRILEFDAHAAATAGRLEVRAVAAGHDPGMADAAIAGIAEARELVIVTANIRHFEPFSVPTSSPSEVIRLT